MPSGLTSFDLGPGLRLGQQLAQLGEEVCRSCALALEAFDALQPLHDGLHLVHASTVAREPSPMVNGSFGDVCQTAARSGAVRSTPSSSRSSSRTSSARSPARSDA